MKMKLIVNITLTILFLATGILSAEETPVIKKSRIAIYNFGMVKPVQEEPAGKTKVKDYSYYSFILPETISKQLQESEKITVTRNKSELTGAGKDINIINRPEYISILSATARETSSDFIVTGRYEIKEQNLNVKIYIYNAATNELQEATATGEETGLYLRNTTDTLSMDIEDKIKAIVVREIEEKVYYPFFYIAKPFTLMSIGLNSGYIWLSGDWKDAYNNAVYYSPYITFDITEFLDITLKVDYFYTDSDGKDVETYSTLSAVGGSALIGLKYQVFRHFGIYFSAGGGMVRSRIDLAPEGPFEATLGKEETNDPAAEAELGFKINLSAFYIKTGALYKRIFYDKEAMNLGIIYGGAGIHF
ncbi:MAG TPA: hypothetical protein PK358_03570 [Spirochaetota bacterium]|nr:hypothetical protein [Spirochaetota bacterium]HPJ33885.1 hypothetical protein [Spirochaetota bacterium]